MAVTLRHYRFTVDEYERLAAAGVLTQCDRVELLDGEIVEMTPIGDRHAGVVARLNRLFVERLGGRSIVWPQNPVGLRVVRSVPQPDLTLLRPRDDFYTTGRPGPDGALLVALRRPRGASTRDRVPLPAARHRRCRARRVVARPEGPPDGVIAGASGLQHGARALAFADPARRGTAGRPQEHEQRDH